MVQNKLCMDAVHSLGKREGMVGGWVLRVGAGGGRRNAIMVVMKTLYQRILLKLSGEALQGSDSTISPTVLGYLAKEIAAISQMGVQVAVVVGGGNIIRGGFIAESNMGIDRVTGDYMGMLATVINGMALHSALTAHQLEVRMQTALSLEQVAAPYIREKAIRHLESNRVMVFTAGTGNPYFTTDTAAALRAAEINAQALFKATNTDGVYSDDPATNADAKRFSQLSIDEAIVQKLKVMDATALTLCRERNLPIHVFQLNKPGALAAILRGDSEGTYLYTDLPATQKEAS